MCGICGAVDPQRGAPSPQTLEAMVRALYHRGPDEFGYYRDQTAGLGHARLSIIDLATGQQPLTNEDERLWIVFNGEIFNYIELAEELVARGHRLRTRSDTEVILHLYEEHGRAFIDRMNGQFAFAIWDRRDRTLLLARDRMGIRPLYFTLLPGGGIGFASEVKSLLAGGLVQARLDPAGLKEILALWSTVAPRTAFAGVESLRPGEMVVWRPHGLERKRYWALTFPPEGEIAPVREEHAAEELLSRLETATRLRLRADVPVGAYMSGGLDSAIITSLVARRSDTPLRTFSVAFEDSRFDERAEQQQMVRAIGADHSEITCTYQDIGERFPDIVWHAETPLLRTAPAPLHSLSALVRAQGFKVVLTGEGADEILAGYNIFKEDRVRRSWAREPESPCRPLLLRRLYPYLPASPGRALAYAKSFFGQGLTNTQDPYYSHRIRWSQGPWLEGLLHPGLREMVASEDISEPLDLPQGFMTWPALSRAQYLETSIFLPGYLLSSQGDRMLMANGVEGRFPFLDHNVVEFCASLPPSLKLRVLREKHLLRLAARPLVPEEVAERPKRPYRAPDSPSFFHATAPAYVEEVLGREAVLAAGLLDGRVLEMVVHKCRRQGAGLVGARDNMALVGALSLMLWHRLFEGAQRPEGYMGPLRWAVAREFQ